MGDEAKCGQCEYTLPKAAYGTSQWKKRNGPAGPTCTACIDSPGWNKDADNHPLLAKAAPKKEGGEEQSEAAKKRKEKKEAKKAELEARKAEEERLAAEEASKPKELPKFRKALLKKGEGVVHPGPKDKVRIAYTGMLEDGTVFDTTLNKKKKHEARLLQVDKLIKGWEEAVKTMTVGEKAEVVIEPEWGYGAKGLTDGGNVIIPPNATLKFELELVSLN
eukprot:TRINITY_DN6435_c0_g1_i1.p1 TRINITY_DN6435_c0_g1~~TRINITY_DN6435_c0_g1_i1.p1  ORF type:complete len:220 (-),score=63.15 TRINITY_DN6435_c0_g1_i1:225-884(-)